MVTKKFKESKKKIGEIKIKICLVTKNLQESKKENWENKNKDLFGYQEIARKWTKKIENIKRLANWIFVMCLIVKKVQHKLIKLRLDHFNIN